MRSADFGDVELDSAGLPDAGAEDVWRKQARSALIQMSHRQPLLLPCPPAASGALPAARCIRPACARPTAYALVHTAALPCPWPRPQVAAVREADAAVEAGQLPSDVLQRMMAALRSERQAVPEAQLKLKAQAMRNAAALAAVHGGDPLGLLGSGKAAGEAAAGEAAGEAAGAPPAAAEAAGAGGPASPAAAADKGKAPAQGPPPAAQQQQQQQRQDAAEGPGPAAVRLRGVWALGLEPGQRVSRASAGHPVPCCRCTAAGAWPWAAWTLHASPPSRPPGRTPHPPTHPTHPQAPFLQDGMTNGVRWGTVGGGLRLLAADQVGRGGVVALAAARPRALACGADR